MTTGKAKAEKPPFYGAVTIGERGQIVIPAAARKDLGLEPGQKLLVYSASHGSGLLLFPPDDLTEVLRRMEQDIALADKTQPEED